MTSDSQNDYFSWPTTTSIDDSSIQRISLDNFVPVNVQQQQDDSNSSQQQSQVQNIQITSQQQDDSSEIITIQGLTDNNISLSTNNDSNSSNNQVVSISNASNNQQAILPVGVVNPDAIIPTNRTYTCRICQVTFPNKSAVTVHSRLHTNHEGKPFRCNFCSKGFSTNFYLKQHERIHNGQKPYKCPMCERSFKQLSHVQQHVRTHTGVRPYKCHWPGCGKAFLQQSHLKSHVARHSPKPTNGLKPFKCHWPDCGKSFAQLNNLKSHIARHQPKKKKISEEELPEQEQITIQVKEVGDGNDDGGENFTIITQNVIGQAAAAANIMPDGPSENSESETIRPFLCPGCSKLYVREATFKKHLEECKTKLQLSITATAAALGIEPPSLPTGSSNGTYSVGTSQAENNVFPVIYDTNPQTGERPAKKRRISKSRKISQNQQQAHVIDQQQMLSEIPIEMSLASENSQIVNAHNLEDVQVKQEVLTLTTDGSGLIQGNNDNAMFKLPQILEGHGSINNLVFNTGASGGLVVTASMNNANDGIFQVSNSSQSHNVHVTTLDSPLNEHLMTSTPSPNTVASSSSTPVSLPIIVSQALNSSQGLILGNSKGEDNKDQSDSNIPGHSTINQAALRWDQPFPRLNFP